MRSPFNIIVIGGFEDVNCFFVHGPPRPPSAQKTDAAGSAAADFAAGGFVPLRSDERPSRRAGRGCLAQGVSLSQKGQALPAEQDWRLTLVNADCPMEEGYLPELATIDASGRQIDRRIAGELQRMLEDMEREGLSPLVCSAYRTWEK